MKTILLILCLTASAVAATPTPTPTPTPTDQTAIHYIFPQLRAGKDFTLNSDGSLAAWVIKNSRFPQPTTAQLGTAKTAFAAQQQTLANIKTGLMAQYVSLPVGERALYKPVLDAVTMRLSSGDLVGAKAIITTAPASTTTLQAAQTAMTALFP